MLPRSGSGTTRPVWEERTPGRSVPLRNNDHPGTGLFSSPGRSQRSARRGVPGRLFGRPHPPAPPRLGVNLIAAAVLAFASVTCAASDPDPKVVDGVFRLPVTVQTDEGPITFQAELADDPAERTRGLMFRESMSDEHGMLFLFPVEQQLSFWMKNTLIPLDIVFIRADRTILGIVREAEPETLSSRMVPGASQFVLEINGGLAEKRGIRAGQKVTFIAPLPDR